VNVDFALAHIAEKLDVQVVVLQYLSKRGLTNELKFYLRRAGKVIEKLCGQKQ
jgi:hypothetical protein